ncbi:MAG: NAD-dependent epimerase/dehydratase family protein [Flavobacteriales bacterium]|nr:NAD-dependent epimerase/dehydratase family protein [Flavobacteriales bacterium]
MVRERAESILITGGSGNLGTKLIEALLVKYPALVIHNIDPVKSQVKSKQLISHPISVTSVEAITIVKKYNCIVVFHLVGIMSSKQLSKHQILDIEINGLNNILLASAKGNVEHFVFVSSGAVYGFKAGMPRYIPESQPMEDENIIDYGQNKAFSEKIIRKFCRANEIEHTIFRPCSILGKTSSNIVSRWFDQKVIIGLNNTLTPFSFVWDEDLVGCMIESMEKRILGTYNVAAFGWVSLQQIAYLQSKKYVTLNKRLLGGILNMLHKCSLIEYKREHLDFIKYRPVLNRNKLKSRFTYRFKKTSLQAFEDYLKTHNS